MRGFGPWHWFLMGALLLPYLPAPYTVSAQRYLMWSEQFTNTSAIAAIPIGSYGWRPGDNAALRKVYKPPYTANTTSVISALSFHYSQDLVFWSEASTKCLYKASSAAMVDDAEVRPTGTQSRDNNTQSEIVHCGTSGVVDGLAVDWLSGLVYWTDRVYRTISVVSHRTGRSRTLISTGLDKPGGITVLPQFGFMFWSDRGSTPRIERANLLGQNRTVIVSSGITEPTDITSDPYTGKIFYLDRKIGIVQMMDVDGQNRKTLLRHVTASNAYWINVFGIAVSKLFIYVSNGVTKKQIRIYFKKSGEWLETINLDGVASDVITYDRYLQPITDTDCWRLSCEHMCINMGNGSGTCTCADGYVLYENGISCKDTSIGAVLLPPSSFPITWLALGLLLALALILICILLGLIAAICRYRRRYQRPKKSVHKQLPLTVAYSSNENGSIIYETEADDYVNEILTESKQDMLFQNSKQNHYNEALVDQGPHSSDDMGVPSVEISQTKHNSVFSSLTNPPSVQELDEIESTLALMDQALEGQVASRDSTCAPTANASTANGIASSPIEDVHVVIPIVNGTVESLRIPDNERKVDAPVSRKINHMTTKEKINQTLRGIFKSKKRPQTDNMKKETTHKKQGSVRFRDFVDNEDGDTWNKGYGQVGNISADPFRARHYWHSRDDGVVMRPGLAWKPQLSREAKGFAPASHGVPVGTMLQTLRSKSHHKPMKMYIKN